jgi:transposase
MIQNWIHAYDKQGLSGLHDRKGRGQRCKLNEEQIQWLRQRIEQGPRPDDQVCVFFGQISTTNDTGVPLHFFMKKSKP